MGTKVRTISINNASRLDSRSVVVTNFNSVDVNQVTGDFVITNTSSNNIEIFPQSSYSYIITSGEITGDRKTISTLGVFGTLSAPLDARFDSTRGKLWICDTGNNRVIRINSFTMVPDFVIDDIIYPYSVVVNPNDGSIFIRGISATVPVGTVYHYSYAGVYIDGFDFTDMKTSYTPFPYITSFDYKKERLWIAAETDQYSTALLMWDIKNSQIVQLNMFDETGRYISPRSLDIDMESGNAILTATTTTESYIFQVFRDNNLVVSTTYLDGDLA